ncbi:isoleucine-valine aminotransferase / aromatic amino acid aminotransferase [Petrocella atlantisensis]|uniref:Branched-chain-amino-acid aminotransferase n=1 Tax=Petrocella atlantisensis TaxID=2173034 RepID=A0A3P7P9T4_9FIRM|nr:branched-chain amino acid aminotransferase [Petrocella atlantisensis]MCF8019555.1 branched-chain amino acid aminotransferase [Vallitaleaceae bacterium]VDN46923.1 isoleucine-valine aminotransferase / aromatic amino acid aminotransferase [Petrocella atlantisensis]
MLTIDIIKAKQLKDKPDPNNLGFGNYFTDHMFVMDYQEGMGWHNPRVKPYEDLHLDPSAVVFHYGQEMFEGLKAYRRQDGEINLFRPDMNGKRLNNTNDRICMPQIPVEDFVQAVRTLVHTDASWVPEEAGTSLYIRPFVIATEPTLMVNPSKSYLFMIILSPVGAYYKEGLNPVRIYVEDTYVRASKGGVGEAKTGGSYGASMIAQKNAKNEGFAQVLWLDAIEHRYVEEVGTMNIFFKIRGKVYTPALSGSILPGITRDSVISLLKSWDIPIYEERISMDTIIEASKNGDLEEVFGTGTAAVISPVGGIHFKGLDFVVHNNEIGPITRRIYDTLTGMQYGNVKDDFGWIETIEDKNDHGWL